MLLEAPDLAAPMGNIRVSNRRLLTRAIQDISAWGRNQLKGPADRRRTLDDEGTGFARSLEGGFG